LIWYIFDSTTKYKRPCWQKGLLKDKDKLTSTKRAYEGFWSRSNGFTFSLTCPFLIANIIWVQKQNTNYWMYNFMRILKKNFKAQTWIDWMIKVLMRTTHVSGRASWAHKLVLVRHFPLIKKSYIVKSLRREKICFFFYNSWSERVEEKLDWVVNFHLITNVFTFCLPSWLPSAASGLPFPASSSVPEIKSTRPA